jgi:predicted nucleotidyltransferase
MPPLIADALLAQRLAMQIADVGLGRVQRVVMIGSRARGTPRPDSDLDLVVLFELPVHDRPWGPQEVIAERSRIHRLLPPPPVQTDLWVRTTDRYEEARRVVGGVEMLVDVEGVEVYSRPPTRAPLVQRNTDQVRREHVSAWVEHALAALEGTLRIERQAAGQTSLPGVPKTPEAAARICVERAVNALLVFHQLVSGKAAGVDGMLSRLDVAERERVAAWLFPRCHAGGLSSWNAVRAVGEVLKRLSEDDGMRSYLAVSLARFHRVTVR